LDGLAKLKNIPELHSRSLKHDELVTRCGLARLDINQSGHAEGVRQFEQAAALVAELRTSGFSRLLLDRDDWAIAIGLGEIALVRNEPGNALSHFRAAEKSLPALPQPVQLLKLLAIDFGRCRGFALRW